MSEPHEFAGPEPRARTRAELAAIDRDAVERLGLASCCLMENAGAGAAALALELLAERGAPRGARVVLLCGRGNNGGDAYVVARHLSLAGARPWLVHTATSSSGDAAMMRGACERMGLESTQCPEGDPAGSELARLPRPWLVVDGLLGTGPRGAPRGPAAAPVRWANQAHSDDGRLAARLALDLPSGLDADDGSAAEPVFRADLTATFAAPKLGFAAPSAGRFLGRVVVVSIGVPG